MDEGALRARLEEIARAGRLKALAVAVQPVAGGEAFAHQGERLFHAASTFKAALLFALLRAVEAGRCRLEDHLHVRNRFLSLVKEAPPYRIAADRDGDHTVHQRVGRSASLQFLAEKMITRSSNLATNLLLDFLTVPEVEAALQEAAIHGLHVRRGVEDMAAHDQGLNNETSARGLVKLFLALQREDLLAAPLRETGLKVLLAQEFRSMLPARLPKGTRVAHKTGEISTYTHDAGLVFPPAGEPYAVALLTEHEAAAEGRQRVVAELSQAVFEHFGR